MRTGSEGGFDVPSFLVNKVHRNISLTGNYGW